MADAFNPYEGTGTTLESVTADISSLQATQADIATQIQTQTADYEALQADLQSQFSEAQTLLGDYATAAQEGLAATGEIDTTASSAYQAAFAEQITNLGNSYALQAQTQAKQLDALVGQGAFSGNAFRAQQAYASSMQALSGEALSQVASTTLSAQETLANIQLTEQKTNLEARTQYMSQLGQAASLTLEAANVYTGSALKVLTGKTGSINSLLEIQASLAKTEASFDFASKELFTQTQLEELKSMTSYKQTQLQASATKYAASVQAKAQEAAAEANIAIADIKAAAAIEQQTVAGQTSTREFQMALDNL